MSKHKPEDLLTTIELSEYWRCSPASLEQHRYTKSGPPYIKAAGLGVRYKFQDVLDYMESHKIGGK